MTSAAVAGVPVPSYRGRPDGRADLLRQAFAAGITSRASQARDAGANRVLGLSHLHRRRRGKRGDAL